MHHFSPDQKYLILIRDLLLGAGYYVGQADRGEARQLQTLSFTSSSSSSGIGEFAKKHNTNYIGAKKESSELAKLS